MQARIRGSHSIFAWEFLEEAGIGGPPPLLLGQTIIDRPRRADTVNVIRVSHKPMDSTAGADADRPEPREEPVAPAAATKPPTRRWLGIRRRRTVKVLLVHGDPYLALLLRMQIPGAVIEQAEDDETALRLLSERPDLVVTPVNPGGTFYSQLVSRPQRPPVVGLFDAEGASGPPPADIDQVVPRPFVPAELHQAVRRALQLPAPRPPRPLLPFVRRFVGAARIGAVALAAVLMVTSQRPAWHSAVLGFAFVYATARLPSTRWPRIAAIIDTAVGAGILVATGAGDSVFVPFAVALAMGVGIETGSRDGFTSGGAVSLALFPFLARSLVREATGPTEVIALLMIFPLIGLAAGYARYIFGGVDPEGAALFAEANRMLSALYRIARAMPGGLDASTVARTAIQEISDGLDAQAGAVLVEETGVLTPASAYGIVGIEALALHPNEGALAGAAEGSAVKVLGLDALAPQHAAVLSAFPRWHIAPVRRGGAVLGLLLAAGIKDEASAPAILQRIAGETALALENARLFSRVRGLSIEEERRRIARDIHDGVAQTLTHVRFELDYLSRYVAMEDETVRRELGRLSRVVGRATEDVRATIVGLRSGIAIGRRLAPALASYLEDLRGLGGPELELQAHGDPLLSEEATGESFRIAQEAISNAMRHADCTRIVIRLASEPDRVILEIEDDGVGMDPDRGPGVGLQSMRERAQGMGAGLRVTSRLERGSLVRLEIPKGGKP